MVNVIDNKLLFIAEHVVTHWNFGTGRDNFWLAHALNVVAVVWGMLGAEYIPVGYFVVVGLFFSMFALIWQADNKSIQSSIAGLKEYSHNNFLVVIRMTLLFLASFLIVLWALVGMSPVIYYPAAYSIVLLFVAYVIGVDRPPFQRSQVWLAWKIRSGKAIPIRIQNE